MQNKRVVGFQLANKKYRIKYVRHDSANLGKLRSPLCEIEIQTAWDGKDVPEVCQSQTIIHEVTHCILDEIGRFDLNEESFVQPFSLLLHQFFNTMELK